jgi:S-formylglutathione hydrolase
MRTTTRVAYRLMGSQLTRSAFRDPLVADEVPYGVVAPEGWTPHEALPLIVLLHGADSSREVLTMAQPILDGMWDDGTIPRSLVACASTPTVGGFYIDRPGGDAWESVISDAFVRHLTESRDITGVSLTGSSMGGYGALKMAVAAPHRWQAVAATAPALLPARTREELRPRNTVRVLEQLADAMAEGDRWAANSVLHRLRANENAVRDSGLPIFLRAGDSDVFRMHDGTEQLHRALWDADIGHEYHLVHEADHLGPEAPAAMRAAFAFIGAAQRRTAGTDRTGADRASEAEWRAWAAAGRQGEMPALDPFGVTAPVALRLMLHPMLNDIEHRDPTAKRRYGVLPQEA